MRVFQCIILVVLVLPLSGRSDSSNDLFSRIEQGNTRQVKEILKQNSDLLNLKNDDGMTPLNFACYLGKAEIVAELIGRGADAGIGDNDNSLPIHCAAISGDTSSIKLLLAYGADINARDNNGMTPLMFAISYAKTYAADLLINRDADINIPANNTMTALHYAVFRNQAEIVAKVLSKGGDPNARTGGNQTPLFIALYNAENVIAELLLDAGARVIDTTPDGTSLVYYAVAFRDPGVARRMLNGEINITETNSLGMTMLHYASARGLTDIVSLLVDEGIDLEAKCINGRTALYYAAVWGHQDIVDFFLTRMAKPVTDDAPAFFGEYLGERKPGRIPEIFAQNKLLTPFSPHGKIAFSPDGREMLWCHQAMPVQAMWNMTMRNDGSWSRPAIAPFTDPAFEYADGAPAFSPDGRRIYYHSLYPAAEGGEPREDTDLFYVENSGGIWGQPQRLDTTINTPHHERDPSLSNRGNLFFVGEGHDDVVGASDIYVSELVNGEYKRPENLGGTVNSEFHDLSPAIAPDESYIVFASNRPIMDRQGMRLYVSFKTDEGSWSDAYRLRGWFNTEPMWRTFITADQRFLFYQEGDNYRWHSTDVIDDIRRAVFGGDEKPELSCPIPDFARSTQLFEPAHTNQVALGDLDGDGDLDAVCSNMREIDSRVWLNDGHGKFEVTEQKLTRQGHGVDLGDLDGDGDLDVFITCASYGATGIENQRASRIYLNDGQARFYETEQNLGDSVLSGNGVWLHDFDGDSDLDALVYYYQEDHVIYLNDGAAGFTRSAIRVPVLAFGDDLDSDGDVDLFLRETGSGYKTLVNDGHGNFAETWQYPDSSVIFGMCSLGDLDNDGDLDIIMASGNDREGVFPTTAWINDGSGRFEKSVQELNVTKSGRISLADLNGDGYLDGFVTNFDYPSAIWINDGRGNLIDTGVRLGGLQGNSGAALGDLDGDGDVDAFISEFFGGSNTIWFNKSQ